MRKLKVLVVDDSPLYRRVLTSILKEFPGFEVVGTAENGAEAMTMILCGRPDVVTLDLEMPVMNGREVMREVRERGLKTKILVISAYTTAGADATIHALALGAFDFITKPRGGKAGGARESLRSQLKVKLSSFLPEPVPERKRASPESMRPAHSIQSKSVPQVGKDARVVAIGSSTGGPRALLSLFGGLAGDSGASYLVVQHMPPVFTKSLADSLDKISALSVKEAEDGDVLLADHAYIAPGGKQMRVERNSTHVKIRITDDPAENYCKPAVDYLFRSVATVFEDKAVGVIMSGMGQDGTLGLKLMKRHCVAVLGQDEASCVVYGMPRAAKEAGVVDQEFSLDRLPRAIEEVLGKHK